jgi:sugar/nucleoside kinase (ribokinase family)
VTPERRPVGIFVGLCTLDVVHEVERLPATDEKVTASAQSVAAGGPATNAAVVFAALGGEPSLVTAVGRGVLADAVRADLAGCGVALVDSAAEQQDIVPASSISVLRGTGERSVVSVDAGLVKIGTAPYLTQLMQSAQVVLADGHHATLAEATARAHADTSVPLVVDAGRWRPGIAALLPRADAVVCSAAFRVPGTTDPEASARALVADSVPTVALTDGAGPVRWWTAGRAGSVLPPAVDAVDTVGAGDALHGAYAYGIAAAPSSSVPARLEFAVQVASLKCRYRGTRTWLAELRGRRDSLVATLTRGQPSAP